VTAPTERPVALAVITALNAALGATRAGYAIRPTGGGPQSDGTFHAYARVHPGSTLLSGGTASDPNADAAQTVQVTYIADSAEAADQARDTGRAALLTPGALTITGRALVNPVTLADSTEVREDNDPQPPLWFAVDRYRIDTTPA